MLLYINSTSDLKYASSHRDKDEKKTMFFIALTISIYDLVELQPNFVIVVNVVAVCRHHCV